MGTRPPGTLAEGHLDLHRLMVVDAGRPDAFGVRRKASTIYALDGGAAAGGDSGAIADIGRPVLDRTNHLQARFESDAERARPLRLAELTEVSDAEDGMLRLAAYAPVRTPDGPGLIGLAVPFLSATSEHTAVQWQLEARSRDLLAVQKAADAGGEWVLVSPVSGRELWSPDGALRLTREHLGLAAADLPSTVAALPDVRATVELHPEVAATLAAPYDWAVLPWAFGFALLFAGLVLPILRLVYNVLRDPGVYAYVTPAVVGLVVAPFTMGIGLAFYHYHLEGNANEFIRFGVTGRRDECWQALP